MTTQFDTIVIGGGIFGVYAALYLAKRGQRVCLLEKEARLFQKASIVNQARLHSGYHYPRSVATARMSDDNKVRFTFEHQDFINFKFRKYYAIDKFGSFTDGQQFERFCEYIGIPCERIPQHPLFNFNRIEALYATTEYSFDPFLIGKYYQEKLTEEKRITTFTSVNILAAHPDAHTWRLQITPNSPANKAPIQLSCYQVINATYAGSNAINRLFGVSDIPLMHEIAEIAFVTSPQVQQIGLTVMDGPFGSLMPYGLSGLLSLSSVAYTHHKVSYNNLPTFDCQERNPACRPDFASNCNTCPAKPFSNYRKMLAQMRQYFSESVDFQYFYSLYTIKSKLKANFIDDGRPTEIAKLQDQPPFYCIFAGKINSIYEIEKLVG
ncbi:MAG TPA: FAD-dependent oxidoreductase [Saprospiraceae bacterium]|nr:FAD-dependent oxidoreductase [Saprospiraceae bacterium]HMP15074.1 FAD-dependent oxidoreductase [Saprospiraceae bacterium]